MSVKGLVVLSALLVAGCVSTAPDAADGSSCSYQKAAPAEVAPGDAEEAQERDPEMLAAREGGTSLTLVRVDGKYILGPNVSLGRYEEDGARALRGPVEGNIVDLRIEDEHVSGAIDNSPVDLAVKRDGTTLEVNGLLASRVSRFRVDDEGLKGRIGLCSYDLARAGAAFTGRRVCSSHPTNFTLELPDTMASWSDADVAATLAVFLR